MTPLRVGIVGLKCYDLLAGVPHPRYVGGAERQQVQLARGLAARGHQVALVTLNDGQEDGTVHAGVRVHTCYAVNAGIPVIRFVHPRWTGLARAMRRADADVFYQMGGDAETGQVALWCAAAGRSFVFGLASDADVDPALPLLRSRRQRVLYRTGLRRAAAVVAQTDTQRERLRQAFSVDSTVIRNCTEDPGEDPRGPRVRAGNPRPRCLWVGRFVAVKRLELLLDLAAAEPDWDFHVVGAANAASEYERNLDARARGLRNVTLHRGISDAALDEQYRRANVLVSTSRVEGVPTTFLEAWARGLPVVSTVDPDDAIAKGRLGAVAAPDRLAESVRAVLAEDPETLAARVRAHFLASHTIDAYVSQHERLFLAVRPQTAPRRSAVGTA